MPLGNPWQLYVRVEERMRSARNQSNLILMTEQAELNSGMPLAREEVTFDQLGTMLEDLAAELQAVANRAKAHDLKGRIEDYESAGGGDDVIDAIIEREIGAVIVRTLSGMKKFRRSYDYHERAIAEWALLNRELTQRDISRYLGIATSTVNRWAQNPLQAQDHQD